MSTTVFFSSTLESNLRALDHKTVSSETLTIEIETENKVVAIVDGWVESGQIRIQDGDWLNSHSPPLRLAWESPEYVHSELDFGSLSIPQAERRTAAAAFSFLAFLYEDTLGERVDLFRCFACNKFVVVAPARTVERDPHRQYCSETCRVRLSSRYSESHMAEALSRRIGLDPLRAAFLFGMTRWIVTSPDSSLDLRSPGAEFDLQHHVRGALRVVRSASVPARTALSRQAATAIGEALGGRLSTAGVRSSVALVERILSSLGGSQSLRTVLEEAASRVEGDDAFDARSILPVIEFPTVPILHRVSTPTATAVVPTPKRKSKAKPVSVTMQVPDATLRPKKTKAKKAKTKKKSANKKAAKRKKRSKRSGEAE